MRSKKMEQKMFGEDVVINKFEGGQGLLNCMHGCGYTGSNDRVAQAVNAMFAPDYAVAGLSIGVAQHVQSDFGSQALAAVATIKGQVGR